MPNEAEATNINSSASLTRCCVAGYFSVEMQLAEVPRKPATLNLQSMPSSRTSNGMAIGLIQIELG